MSFSLMPSKTGVANLNPSSFAAQPKCVSKHLTDVHARRHAQRIQHDVHRSSVLEERHVFFGDDLGDDALVTVASGHLVTDRELALRGDVHLDLLDDAHIDFVAGFSAFDFLVVLHLQIIELLLKLPR